MKLIKLLLAGLAFSFLYSCDNVTEEIYLNTDGSGEYKIHVDVVPGMTQMMGGIMAMDTTSERSDEELEALIQDQIWEDHPSGVVDSIYGYDQVSLDSMPDNPEAMAFAQSVKLFIKGTREENFLNYGVKFNFKNINQLNDFMKLMSKENEKADKDDSNFALAGTNKNVKVDTAFKYKKRCLKRSQRYTTIKEQDPKEVEGLRKLFGEGIARTIVYLPKNVKSVKGNGITEKTDDKVVFEYNIVEMSLGNVDTDFEIKLEK